MHGWLKADSNLQEGKEQESGNGRAIRAQHLAQHGASDQISRTARANVRIIQVIVRYSRLTFLFACSLSSQRLHRWMRPHGAGMIAAAAAQAPVLGRPPKATGSLVHRTVGFQRRRHQLPAVFERGNAARAAVPRSTRPTTWPRSAPKAIRMPISLRRCAPHKPLRRKVNRSQRVRPINRPARLAAGVWSNRTATCSASSGHS